MKKHIIIAVILAMLTLLAGCGGTGKTETAEPVTTTGAASAQNLTFSVVEAEDKLDDTRISPEELGDASNVYLTYGGLTEVNVSIDGADIPLPEAIRDGKLAVPEIYAFARMDAQNGICTEAYASELGLTHFTYIYPGFKLVLAYDVYETPDGQQTLIEDICIYNRTRDIGNLGHVYVDEESEWGYFLDREDWGLSFETADVSPTQITLNYTQQGGQQLGDLQVDGYMLSSMVDSDDSDIPGEYIGMSSQDTEGLPIPLMKNSSGQITIDWSSVCDALAPGRYYIKLTVSDIYEESDIHPLMTNFYDKQSYHVTFTIE